MKNELIIFDCFGVIFEDIAPVFLKRYLPEECVGEIKERLFFPADMGEVTYEELLYNMSKELNVPVDKIIPEWNSLFIIKDETVALIRELHKKHDIALVSNAPLGVVEDLIEKHKLHDLFDKTVISCNVRMTKPDPQIYKYCVSLFEKNYDKIYMVDDSIINLERLPEIGIIPIHFRKTEDVIKKINSD